MCFYVCVKIEINKKKDNDSKCLAIKNVRATRLRNGKSMNIEL